MKNLDIYFPSQIYMVDNEIILCELFVNIFVVVISQLPQSIFLYLRKKYSKGILDLGRQ